jgi:hypothetical protein
MSRAAEGAADQLLHVSSQRLSTWAALWLAEMCLEAAPGLPPRISRVGHGRRTVLPVAARDSIVWCAAGASARANRWPMTGASRPSAAA